jgi:ribosome-binding ATPase YchF (GTP1/OBG family)
MQTLFKKSDLAGVEAVEPADGINRVDRERRRHGGCLYAFSKMIVAKSKYMDCAGTAQGARPGHGLAGVSRGS